MDIDIVVDIDIDVDVVVDVDIDGHFGCFKGGCNVSSGTVLWYRDRYGTDFDPQLYRSWS